VDLRQSKRYRLRAFVVFTAEQLGGLPLRGEGYTRDISPSGVFVFTGIPLPSGVVVNLEIMLPSLRGQRSGACLRTVGHVVRSEDLGFAAVADLGFRMHFPESRSEDSEPKKSGGNSGSHEAGARQRRGERSVHVLRV
jgi:hypothetical protein